MTEVARIRGKKVHLRKGTVLKRVFEDNVEEHIKNGFVVISEEEYVNIIEKEEALKQVHKTDGTNRRYFRNEVIKQRIKEKGPKSAKAGAKIYEKVNKIDADGKEVLEFITTDILTTNVGIIIKNTKKTVVPASTKQVRKEVVVNKVEKLTNSGIYIQYNKRDRLFIKQISEGIVSVSNTKELGYVNANPLDIEKLRYKDFIIGYEYVDEVTPENVIVTDLYDKSIQNKIKKSVKLFNANIDFKTKVPTVGDVAEITKASAKTLLVKIVVKNPLFDSYKYIAKPNKAIQKHIIEKKDAAKREHAVYESVEDLSKLKTEVEIFEKEVKKDNPYSIIGDTDINSITEVVKLPKIEIKEKKEYPIIKDEFGNNLYQIQNKWITPRNGVKQIEVLIFDQKGIADMDLKYSVELKDFTDTLQRPNSKDYNVVKGEVPKDDAKNFFTDMQEYEDLRYNYNIKLYNDKSNKFIEEIAEDFEPTVKFVNRTYKFHFHWYMNEKKVILPFDSNITAEIEREIENAKNVYFKAELGYNYNYIQHKHPFVEHIKEYTKAEYLLKKHFAIDFNVCDILMADKINSIASYFTMSSIKRLNEDKSTNPSTFSSVEDYAVVYNKKNKKKYSIKSISNKEIVTAQGLVIPISEGIKNLELISGSEGFKYHNNLFISIIGKSLFALKKVEVNNIDENISKELLTELFKIKEPISNQSNILPLGVELVAKTDIELTKFEDLKKELDELDKISSEKEEYYDKVIKTKKSFNTDLNKKGITLNANYFKNAFEKELKTMVAKSINEELISDLQLAIGLCIPSFDMEDLISIRTIIENHKDTSADKSSITDELLKLTNACILWRS